MSTADPTVAAAAQEKTLLDTPDGAVTGGHSTEDATTTTETKTPGKLAGKYDTPEALEKAYKELETRLGSSVLVPGEDASSEDRAKFFRKIGRPESSEGYELPKSDIPGGSDEDVKLFREVMFKGGASKQFAESFWKWSNETGKARIAVFANEVKTARDTQANTLRSEWGDGYDGKAQLAGKVATRFGGEEFLGLMRQSRLGDHPIVMKTLAAIGAVLTEDVLEGGDGKGTPAVPRIPGRLVLEYPNSPKLKK